MQQYRWNSIEKEQLSPTIARQVIHGESLTVARIFIKKGGIVPTHSHPNEQLSMLQEGELRFVLDGREVIVGPGEALRIPPQLPHSVEALEDSLAVDVFSPAREDWIRGDDAYLRR